MQRHQLLVALLVVLTLGSAVAPGGALAQPDSIEAQSATLDGSSSAVAAADSHLSCEYPMELEDDSGETVTIEEEPESVVALNANVAQQIWEMGGQEKVTGMPVAFYTSYLEGYDERTNVIEEGGTNVLSEEIVDLDPDLVISPDTTRSQIDELRDLGLTVYQHEQVQDLDHMVNVTELTGQLIGECEAAEQLGTELREDIEVVDVAMEDVEPVDIYYDQGYPFTVGEGSLEHDLFTRAGANNVVPDDYLPEFGYGEVQSQEDIAEWNPEYLIISEGAEVPEGEGFQSTTAVEEDNIIEVDPNALSQHGPRNIEVLTQIAETLHPEAMEEAREELADEGEDDGSADDGSADDDSSADDSTDDSADDGSTDDSTDDDSTEDDSSTDDSSDEMDDASEDDSADDADDSGPGMTVVAALVALVALALVATRRR